LSNLRDKIKELDTEYMEHKQAMYAQELELQNVKAEKDKEAKRLVITANVQHVTYISYFL
jgi:hypothetical protein